MQSAYLSGALERLKIPNGHKEAGHLANSTCDPMKLR